MKIKWAPTCYIDAETGEVLRRDFKDIYYYKALSRWEEIEWNKDEKIIHTFKLIKIYGKREGQLDLF